MIPTKPIQCPTCLGIGSIYKVHGSDLRQVRLAAGVSIRKLASQIGLSAAYLSDVELGRRNVTEFVAQAYGDLR